MDLSLLGRALVLLGLALAGAGSVVGFAGGARRSLRALRLARQLGLGFAASMLAANLVMVWALVTHDFSVSYVAEVGTVHTPLHITIISLWSSLSGSILLWGGVLGLYVGGLILALGERHRAYQSWTLGTLLAICVFFALLVGSVADPFEPTSAQELQAMVARWGARPDGLPADGPGPNPLLQNHWLMAVHPPTLYLGYVGMALPFAMAAAALFAGRLEAGWIAPLRRAFLVPYAFLTLGIVLGGWWSYEVLGWGGYWAWDPVENASFMPWLTGTAFLHSAMLMQRRAALKTWTLILAMLTFLLTLFGTFLTRSGVFNSVHAFSEGDVGPLFLGFIALGLLFSVVLLSLREHVLHEAHHDLPGPASKAADAEATPMSLGLALALLAPPAVAITGALWSALPVDLGGVMVPQWAAFVWLPLLGLLVTPRFLSRDATIQVQNVTFTVFTFVVFLGTVYPLLAEALRDTKVSVGEPFYDAFALPLGVIIVWLMGVGPMLPWGTSSVESAWRRFLPPLSAASAFTVLFWASGMTKPYTLLAVFVVLFAVAANLQEYLGPVIRRWRSRGPAALTEVAVRGRRRFGGHIAHYGILMMVFVVALSKGYSDEGDFAFQPGESAEFADYTLTFRGVEVVDEGFRESRIARFDVFQDGQQVATMEPRLNQYAMRMEALGDPAVRSTVTHDLYLSLMSAEPDGSFASLRVMREPYIVWLWVAPFITFFGTLLAAWPERRRRRAPAPAPADGVRV